MNQFRNAKKITSHQVKRQTNKLNGQFFPEELSSNNIAPTGRFLRAPGVVTLPPSLIAHSATIPRFHSSAANAGNEAIKRNTRKQYIWARFILTQTRYPKTPETFPGVARPRLPPPNYPLRTAPSIVRRPAAPASNVTRPKTHFGNFVRSQGRSSLQPSPRPKRCAPALPFTTWLLQTNLRPPPILRNRNSEKNPLLPRTTQLQSPVIPRPILQQTPRRHSTSWHIPPNQSFIEHPLKPCDPTATAAEDAHRRSAPKDENFSVIGECSKS